MPTVKLTISKKFDRNEKENLALELTALVAKEIGKPEAVTQAIIADDAVVSFGGNFLAPSAFLVVMSVGGLPPEVCKRLSARYLADTESADSASTSTFLKSAAANGAGTLIPSEFSRIRESRRKASPPSAFSSVRTSFLFQSSRQGSGTPRYLKYSCPHPLIASTIGTSVSPNAVKEYSVFGGTTG